MDYRGKFLHDANEALQAICGGCTTDIVAATQARSRVFRPTAPSVWAQELAEFAQLWCEDIGGKQAEFPAFLASTRAVILQDLLDGNAGLVENAADLADAFLQGFYHKVRLQYNTLGA